jgi:hypothetical protein
MRSHLAVGGFSGRQWGTGGASLWTWSGLSVLDHLVAINRDATVWADSRAESTPCAIMVGIEQNDRAIALDVQVLGEDQDVRWAGFAAQLTAFAPFYVDYNSSSCHLKYLQSVGITWAP